MMRILIILSLFLAVLAAACETSIPTVPPIVINITAVDDTTALADGVAQALTGTASNGVMLTETQYAREGITLTPTLTATATNTPSAPTATRQLTPTPSYTPSDTPSPTFAPYPTNTVTLDSGQSSGRLRVLHAWVEYSDAIDSRVDVYINDVRVAHAMEVRQATAYQRVAAGVARISLYPTQSDPALQLSLPPLISLSVEVPSGGSLSLVMVDLGQGLTLVPVIEDVSPLPSGMSRLTLLQANPELLEVNVLVPAARRTLAANLKSADIVGPIDLPRDNYRLELYDSALPELFVAELGGINLTAQVNHLLVLVPSSPGSPALLDSLLFSGSTRLVETDVHVRFIHAANRLGPLAFSWERQTQIPLLNVGDISVAVPMSSLGTELEIRTAEGSLVAQELLAPWTEAGERSDKLIVILNAAAGSLTPVQIAVFSQDAPSSAIRANLRLINALPDTVPLALQTSLVGAPQGGEDDDPWEILAANVRYGQGSNYVGRAPGLYEVRVVLTGTDTIIASLPPLPLLAGGAYQFIVTPGAEPGSARLLMIQPEVQVGLASAQDPAAIAEIIEATLTAFASPIVNTPTPVRTPTPTITPVPTNTPHPTNTASIPQPELLVDPVPPDAAEGVFTLGGINFAPGERYSVSLDNGRELQSGRVGDDGAFITVIAVPDNIAPGPHIVRVCVDCRRDGLQQADYAIVIVADPNATPTPTPIP